MPTKKNKKILICIDWFEPAYKAGGPVRSIKNMLELLKSDFDFYILTSDRDHGDEQAFENVELNTWIEKDGFSVYYLSQNRQNYKNIADLLEERDYSKYYFNSLFSLKFTLLPLLILRLKGKTRKVVLAPRGMLGKGALELKAAKKKLFLSGSRFLGLYKNIRWHASTQLEENEIKQAFGSASKVKVAQNIAQKVGELEPLVKEDEVRFVFFSRISPKKNLLIAIELFNGMQTGSKKVVFDIYGPVEEKDYWQKCENAIKNTQGDVQISYRGQLQRAELFKVLSQYHFLLFPTKNENFGHNIAEALLSGLPVVISDQTPWQDLEQQKAGWDIPLENTNGFRSAIKRAVEMDNVEYQQWRNAARKFAESRLFSEEVIEANKQLF